MSVNHTSHLTMFTHKEHVDDREVDPKQLSHWSVLLRDGEFKHLPIRAEELVCVVLYGVEVVVEACSIVSVKSPMEKALYATSCANDVECGSAGPHTNIQHGFISTVLADDTTPSVPQPETSLKHNRRKSPQVLN